MLFNSPQFLIFFPIVTVLFFALPHRFRWALLLVASCIFYMAFIPIYILILFFTIIIDYIAGIFIEQNQGKRRRLFLIISIISNVGILAFFKYYNFFQANYAGLARFLHWNYGIPALSIILPIGLSFHTFQAMSYTIEVYRGNHRAERHLGIFALYVMFYPQLVAGPIERPQNMLHQFYKNQEFNYERVKNGLLLMAWGLFKKVVVADRLALFVNYVYRRPTDFQGVPLIIATVMFSFQIFCDFSGYSDIAIGSAQVMGFKLTQNFKRPYFSKSIDEFWRRWHISLSSWFRDYLYISLGGNRVAKWRWYLNLFIVFLVSGLWHGASWTFVVWGGIHGTFIIVSRLTTDIRKKLENILKLDRLPRLNAFKKIVMTFFLVNVAWIFFRANSISDAFYIVTHLFSGFGNLAANVTNHKMLRANITLGQDRWQFLLAISGIALMESIHVLQSRGIGFLQVLSRQPIWLRWGLYYTIILVFLFARTSSSQSFIYFQF